MSHMFSTTALTRMSARHPWRAVLAWVIVLAIAVGIMGLIGMRTTTDFDFVNQPESMAGWEKLEEAGLVSQEPNNETVIIRSGSMTIDDPEFQAHADEVVATLRGMENVVVPASVISFYELKSEPSMEAMANALVSADRDTLLIPLTLAGTQDEAAEIAPLYRETLAGLSGGEFDVLSIGMISSGEELMKMGEEDMVRGEAIGIGTAVVILVIVFGALVAAGLPILLSLVSIAISFGITASLSQMWSFSFFITNMITMIGLAVGIDYTLFVVERYREERRHGREKLEAITATGGSASKAVAFSGGTVVLALIGMFILPVTIFRAMATGAIVVVLVSIAMTLTLVPAMLSLLGDRIDWPRKRNYAATHRSADDPHDLATVYQGFWGRLTKVVMARPIISVALSAGLLLALAVPYLDITIGASGNESTPEESAAHRGYDILVEDFSAGRLSPVQFVVTGEPEAVESGIRNLRVGLLMETLDDGLTPAFVTANENTWFRWSENGEVALAEATLSIAANDPQVNEVIRDLREDIVPAAFEGTGATVYVTGEAAFGYDFTVLVETYTPIVFTFVLTMSFLLLLLAFRSVVVAAKAILMNLLSVGAAYGLLVLVFQKGIGNDILGLQQTQTIEVWLPLFLFTVLFGLSMDYHVFLLSRIREHYDMTGHNRDSVAVGLHSTAKIITGAALIMVAVFGGFASGQLVMLQQMGFGLGVAVLLDATVVRSILVPAAMALLGDLNWYLPRWLQWLPDLRVEGGEAVPATATATVEATPVTTQPHFHLPHLHLPRLGH
jgi:putative drug exporter of the RND superfamily